MLSLSSQTSSARPVRDDVIARALETSGAAWGGVAGSPCAFCPLGEPAAPLLSELRAEVGGEWILVTVPRSAKAGRRLHLRERSLTAVQRFMLALACDGVDSRWVAEAPDAEALQAAGVEMAGREPVGLVWCAGP